MAAPTAPDGNERYNFMPTGMALAALLTACAPRVGTRTLAAIISVESGGNAYAIHDNTSGRSYFPRSPDRATDLAVSLVASGHSVDLGLSQINSMNLPGMALSVADMFDPCTNVRTSARILTGAYRRAAARFGPGQVALRHALGAYNTGSIYAGRSYISLVLAAAGSIPRYRHVYSVAVAVATPRTVIHQHRSVVHHVAHHFTHHVLYRIARVAPVVQRTAATATGPQADFTVEATAL